MPSQQIINACVNQGVATFRTVNAMLDGFIRECATADCLPDGFTLDVSAMTLMEREIETWIVKGDLQKTEDLCGEYQERFTQYLDRWRAQLKQEVTV